MDKFIAYTAQDGFFEFESSDATTAHQTCMIDDQIFLGYKKRFLQNLTDFLNVSLDRALPD
jgi:hypothetical protein